MTTNAGTAGLGFDGMNNNNRINNYLTMSDDHGLILPAFSCNDYLDGADLDYINSLLESPDWDDSTQHDGDVSGIDSADEYLFGSTTAPSEFVPEYETNAIHVTASGEDYCAAMPDRNLQYSSLIALHRNQQQQQLFPAVLTAVPEAPGSFISQQQQNAIVNIQQLERLTESMKRSEVTRRQVQLQRQVMVAAAQQKQQMKSMDTETMQKMSNWLGSRIAQSKKQLQAYANTMRYFD
jgi:hypothetical protein